MSNFKLHSKIIFSLFHLSSTSGAGRFLLLRTKDAVLTPQWGSCGGLPRRVDFQAWHFAQQEAGVKWCCGTCCGIGQCGRCCWNCVVNWCCCCCCWNPCCMTGIMYEFIGGNLCCVKGLVVTEMLTLASPFVGPARRCFASSIMASWTVGAAVAVGDGVVVGGSSANVIPLCTLTQKLHMQRPISSFLNLRVLHTAMCSEKNRSPVSSQSCSAFGNGISVMLALRASSFTQCSSEWLKHGTTLSCWIKRSVCW